MNGIEDPTVRESMLSDMRDAARAMGSTVDVDLKVIASQATVSIPEGHGRGPWRIVHDASLVTPAQLIAAAKRLGDRHALAMRREAAIRAAGRDPDAAPAWAYLTHPLAAALLATRLDLDSHVPAPTLSEDGVTATVTLHHMRIGYTLLRLTGDGPTMELDAGNDMARLQIEGDFATTVEQGIVGMPIGEVLGITALQGRAGAMSQIRDAWRDGGFMAVTVRSALEPLAPAPDGIDTSWLQEWLERHA